MSPRASRAPLRIACVGALGRMGERVRAALADANDAELAGALEGAGHPALGRELAPGVVVSSDARAAFARADAVIDFSMPASSLAALRAAAEQGIAYVCGTTGFSPAEQVELATLAKRLPLVLAPNFSVAVNVLAHLVGEAARLLGPGFDAEIVELHHAAKRDAPSGTALRLAAAIAAARGQDLGAVLVEAREGDTGARPPGTIGVQALRGGDSPGEHTVLLVGRGERLELVHRAATRDHFAAGALRAARWAHGRAPGFYGMEDVLALGARA
jgi:4-hydroxy-tetrahydrodipicolinate reductase